MRETTEVKILVVSSGVIFAAMREIARSRSSFSDCNYWLSSRLTDEAGSTAHVSLARCSLTHLESAGCDRLNFA
jgi:hypothetical protein